MTFLDCASTFRKKRAGSSQTQHITLTTATAEKFDIESLIKWNQSNSNKTFPVLIGLSAITYYHIIPIDILVLVIFGTKLQY